MTLLYTKGKDVASMQTTVNDVRNRLFRLFSPVINTPEFHEKYLSFSTLTDLQKRYDICEENWGLTMAYIHAIALHLDDKEFPSIANRTVPPEIVLTAYTVYWQVTQELVQADQDRKLSVPDSDSDFLTYMFSDFLGKFSSDNGIYTGSANAFFGSLLFCSSRSFKRLYIL